MTVEQYIRDGIDDFNSKKHKPTIRVGFKMAFFDAPYAALKAIFTSPVEGEGFWKRVGNITLRVLFFAVLASIYNVSFEYIDLKFDFHSVVTAILPIAAPWMVISGFVLIIMILGYFDHETVASRRLGKKYRKVHPEGVHFSSEEYKKAEEVLRVLKPITREKAIEKYSEKIVDLLELSGAAMVINGKYRRLGSIRAIEEDREAGPEDDEE